MKMIFSLLLAVSFFVLDTGMVSAGIVGSSHDFSSSGWSGGRICVPCHAPHNTSLNVTGAPLWNHSLTSASFTMYVSPTLDFPTEAQPRGISKLCLSCHDGTVALDSYSSATGSNYMSADFVLGIDLSNDHPISLKWQHQVTALPNCQNCHFAMGNTYSSTLPFYDGYVECASCHDVHNGTNFPKLLRLSMQGSELCFQCHGK